MRGSVEGASMTASDFSRRYQTKKIRAEAAALRVRSALLRLRTKAGFDPNQPRVPAGNLEGGQWTDGGGGSSGRSSASRIVSAASAARTTRMESVPGRVFRDRRRNTGEYRNYADRRLQRKQ